MEKTYLECAWNFVKLNDLEELQKIVPRLVDANSSLPDQNNDIRSLIHAAAAFGSLACLQYLFDSGGDLSHTSDNGFCTVHWAAYGGWIEIISFLLKHACQDRSNQTPLHIASARGHLNVVEFLITNKVNLNSQAEFGWTPLHFAVAYGHRDICKVLIKSGADISKTDSLGRSPKILACEYKRNWWSETEQSALT